MIAVATPMAARKRKYLIRKSVIIAPRADLAREYQHTVIRRPPPNARRWPNLGRRRLDTDKRTGGIWPILEHHTLPRRLARLPPMSVPNLLADTGRIFTWSMKARSFGII